MLVTDWGSQFTNKSFYYMTEKLGIIHSMSCQYTSIDNRFIETFWKTMKTEIEAQRNYTEENHPSFGVYGGGYGVLQQNATSHFTRIHFAI